MYTYFADIMEYHGIYMYTGTNNDKHIIVASSENGFDRHLFHKRGRISLDLRRHHSAIEESHMMCI
jgi:hypothetical protein